MGNTLPAMDRATFEHELETQLSSLATHPQNRIRINGQSREALWIHYRELLRWNPRLSLIGPGSAAEIMTRHYGESLAALPHLPDSALVLDAGSGGGFPGFVLAAARPGLDVTLMEPKQRKWSFLNTVIRKVKSAGIALSCRALDARVDSPLPVVPALPENIDIVTSRALALGPERLAALVQKYPGVRFLLWASDPEGTALQAIDSRSVPSAYRVAGRIHLQGSRHRFIVDLKTRSEHEGKQDGP